MILPPEVPFFVVQKQSLLPKVPIFETKKWHFWWHNQNSKTTFIIQTIPKYCSKGVYFMNLSLLSPILVKFQFCWFSGLFWAFFPSKKCKHENLSPNVNFWSITLKFFLWTHTTHEHAWLKGCSSIKKKVKNGTPYSVDKFSARESWYRTQYRAFDIQNLLGQWLYTIMVDSGAQLKADFRPPLPDL